MRTNVVIDDKLMARAMEIGDYQTKRSAIEAGLRLLVQMNAQQQLLDLPGTVVWEEDLEASRRD